MVSEVKCFSKIEKHDSGGGSFAIRAIQPRMCDVSESVNR